MYLYIYIYIYTYYIYICICMCILHQNHPPGQNRLVGFPVWLVKTKKITVSGDNQT